MNNIITNDDKKKALDSAMYLFRQTEPFAGTLLQQLTIKYFDGVPTACITFNSKIESIEIYLNSTFFLNLSKLERVSILHHEILHFINKHLFRGHDDSLNSEDLELYNIAKDIAINQYIKNLPAGCVNVDEFKYKDEHNKIVPFPKYKTMDQYFELLKTNYNKNKDVLNTFKPIDEHNWENLDEETKQKLLQEAKKVIKRTLEKTQTGHSSMKTHFEDLLQELEHITVSVEYKNILKNVIKKTTSSINRINTWNRSNKRYGVTAPGTKNSEVPKITFYNDSSGSISITEQNQYLKIMDGFLSVGSKKCDLAFWHTELYYKDKYKKGQEIDPSKIQSGGTDLTCVFEDIKKTKPNLSIILTDGYFDTVSVNVDTQVIFIISEDGNLNHPMSHIGKTIPLNKLK